MKMYRPPENCNRVKSIKSKFENVDNKDHSTSKHGSKVKINQQEGNFGRPPQNLLRQISDPAKRSIKRTPAFRIDVNSEKPVFQRTAVCNRSFYFERVQQYNDVSKNNNNKSEVPVLQKSKSAHNFELIRSKFDTNVEKNDSTSIVSTNSNNNVTNAQRNMTLYTKPIPKALRDNVNKSFECNNNNESECSNKKKDNYNATEVKENITSNNSSVALTGTLEAALNRPLPKGPAPQKPPRTFEHNPVKISSDLTNKNTSFLHGGSKKELKKVESVTDNNISKHDARYMLNKLENALRNNKIRTKKLPKIEHSTTSGEDSDDSVLFKSKANNKLPKIPNLSNAQPFNFNCLHGLTCNSSYEKIKEPNAEFFVNCQSSEPIYDEPFNVPEETSDGKFQITSKNEVDQKRDKTLYYLTTKTKIDNALDWGDYKSSHLKSKLNSKLLFKKPPSVFNNPDLEETHHTSGHEMINSTSLLCDEGCNCCSNMSEHLKEQDTYNCPITNTDASRKQVSEETSSQSSFMSDVESPVSTPLDENESFETSNKIKELISSFETKLVPTTSSKHKIHDVTKDCDHGEEAIEKQRKSSFNAIVDKFQSYVKTMPKYERPNLSVNERLFYCCLLVGWDSEKPQIKFKFPKNVAIPDRIEDLCFPEAASGPLDISNNAQCYSLVITNDKGERTFGYCRRVIPEGSSRCIPLTYCILSKHRAPRFYKKILTELESRHGIPYKLRDELISCFYHNKFPRPGESIKIRLPKCAIDLLQLENIKLNGHDPSELIVTLHHDTRYEEADLKPLHTLHADILLKIFASLLLERKVVLISCVISKLSCCVDALQSILYPFSWPHTFIPILPECLWDVVESPTPVICGILSVSAVNNYKIEHGIVVDLDEGCILSQEGDEDKILSSCMKKAWQQGMNLAKKATDENYVHSVYLSDAYLKVFIVSLKHYKNHISGNIFDKESFIKNAKTKGIKRFLKWFTETTMFVSFIETVISNPSSYGLFDQKIKMYGSNESDIILTKLLEWKK